MYRNAFQLFYHALVDLGHGVEITDGALDPGALNLLAPPMAFRVPGLAESLVERRIRYGVIGVETFDGYSHGMTPETRQDDTVFRRFVADAAAVLCIFRDDVDSYRALGARAIYARYGFHPRVEEIAAQAERPIDVFFFGDVKNRPGRQRVLDAVAQRGLRVDALTDVANMADPLIRNARIARAKINLNINHASHVSPQRVAYLANNRMCCLSDSATDADGYLALARAFPSEAELIDGVTDRIASGRYRADSEAAYEAARRWPMSEILARALDQMESAESS
ncbi:MAG: hypothetical protein FJX52_02435 [Alphaproteobacteria bacterium]|nr:hypothetical protein [Alphaproteobacteria bacterium]